MYRFDGNCHKLAAELMVITLLFFVLFTFLIVWLGRRSTPILSMREVFLTFGAKVLAASAYGYLFLRYYQGDDTWEIHQGGLNEWHLLTTAPGEFFMDFLPIKAWKLSGGDVQAAWHYYLDKLEWHLQVKPLAIANLVSRGNYYANAVFFSFLTFWGHYLLFKLTVALWPAKRTMLLGIIFLFPPVLFWLSGIRSDGLLFLSFSAMMYHGHQWLQERRSLSALYMLTGLAGIFLFRNELLLVLLPGLIAWYLTVRHKRQPVQVFAIVYGTAIVLLLASSLIPGLPNPLQWIVNKQQAFMTLEGNTRYALTPLTPDAGSFLLVFPQAFTNTFLRPFLWEARGALQLLSALEILFCWAWLIILLVRWDTTVFLASRPAWCSMILCFSVLYYLLIGYVVPFPGAIVRYKAIPELLLLVLMTGFIRPWSKAAAAYTPLQKATGNGK